MNHSAARQCQGKVRHTSEHAGRLAVAGTIRETGDPALVHYFCEHCQGYHVGHPPKREQRALRVQRLVDLIEHAVRQDRRPANYSPFKECP